MPNLDTRCLPTPTCLNSQGYGHLRYQNRVVRAHRLAYVLAHGLTLADIHGVEIRHACDNPCCINPDHLEPGTHADNMRDMFERNRRIAAKGVRCAKSKLTDEQVRQIRVAIGSGETHASIGARFGVHASQVTRIGKRAIWGHVE